ncbi:MAG TPA: DUF4360 domain-containing protein [Polyangiaceae bacterium]
MNVRTVVLAVFLVLPFTSPAAAGRATVDQLTISGITYSGTGCPAQSVSYTWTEDGGLFELLFSDFELTIGPGIPTTETESDCAITVDVLVPDGFEPWVPAVEYHGFAQLDPGITAARVSAYKLTGDPPAAPFKEPIQVAPDGSYTFVDRLDEPACSNGKGPPVKHFKIRTRARLAGKSGTGLLDFEQAAGGVQARHLQSWHIAAHKCS